MDMILKQPEQQVQSFDDLLQFDQDLLWHDLVPSESSEWTIIKAKNRLSGEIETYKIVGGIAENPGAYLFFTHNNKHRVWEWVEVITSWQERAEQQKLAKARKHAQATTPIIKRVKRNRQHEKAYIVLHEEQTVTCEDTGISYTVRLPIPTAVNQALNLPVLHPLAFYENVRTLLHRYNNHGLMLEHELEAQVLAGMLLTILRHRNLLVCKDAPKANMFLHCATKETLAHAVRWFNNRPSTIGFPALSVDLADSTHLRNMQRHIPLSDNQKATQEAEQFIWCYIKACKGESTKDEAAHIQIKKVREINKVKVYTDRHTQQVKDAQQLEKDGISMLNKLVAEYPGQHTLLFGQIKQTLKILAMASEKLRKDLARKLRDTFPLNEHAIEIASILSLVQQDAIEDDLPSFTQQLKQEISQFKSGKVDFMSKLAPKGNG